MIWGNNNILYWIIVEIDLEIYGYHLNTAATVHRFQRFPWIPWIPCTNLVRTFAWRSLQSRGNRWTRCAIHMSLIFELQFKNLVRWSSQRYCRSIPNPVTCCDHLPIIYCTLFRIRNELWSYSRVRSNPELNEELNEVLEELDCRLPLCFILMPGQCSLCPEFQLEPQKV